MKVSMSRPLVSSPCTPFPIYSLLRSLHTGFPFRERQRPSAPSASSDNDDYYSLLLSSPLPSSASSSKSPTVAGRSTTSSPPQKGSTPSKANIVFGSRLAGPAAARSQKGWAEARPKEPDNCCMSGCVNCVWDLYREEVEEWAAREKKAHRRDVAQESAKARSMRGRGRRDISKDSEGEIGDTDEVNGMFEGVDLGDEGLFEKVPVGIREFMKTEKRLRERREADKG